MKKALFSEQIIDTFTNTTDTNNAGTLLIQPPSSWTGRPDAHDANNFTVESSAYSALVRAFYNNGDLFSEGVVYDSGNNVAGGSSDIASYIRDLDHAGVNALADSIAASMTKRIRVAPGNENVGLGNLTYCKLYQDIPYVNVRWGWIAFPAALVFLDLLFLLARIFEHTRNGAMLWKANSLINFYHPLTKEGRDTLQSGNNATEAEEIAENMKVRWYRTEAGYRLVQRHEI
jgi:hypothetical protein